MKQRLLLPRFIPNNAAIFSVAAVFGPEQRGAGEHPGEAVAEDEGRGRVRGEGLQQLRRPDLVGRSVVLLGLYLLVECQWCFYWSDNE